MRAIRWSAAPVLVSADGAAIALDAAKASAEVTKT
jgi:hypothetical protein